MTSTTISYCFYCFLLLPMLPARVQTLKRAQQQTAAVSARLPLFYNPAKLTSRPPPSKGERRCAASYPLYDPEGHGRNSATYDKSGDPHNLRRYLVQQEASFEQALSEISHGRKRSHW